jgi:acetyl-CoA/propionyl-CoA carboxylase biotin carboxyl carrier protein
MSKATLSRVAEGKFVVTIGDRREVVYVAGPSGNRWAFWSGEVFHSAAVEEAPRSRRAAGTPASETLSAPMPATVVKVLVAAGDRAAKGMTVVVLEAMKMELPIRTVADGVVKAVLCQPGELVQADQPLIVME